MSDVPKTVVTEGCDIEARLRQASRALLLFSRCNKAVVHATDEVALLDEVCRIAVETAGYRLAWVGHAEHDADRTIGVVAYCGPDEVFQRLRISWGDNEYGRGATGSAIRTRLPVIARHIAVDPDFASWRRLLIEQEVNSAAAIPMFVSGDVFGVLVVYAPEPDAFDPTEVGLLEELGATISYGIAALRTESDRSAARLLDRLRQSQTVGEIGSWEIDLATRSMWGSEEAFRIYSIPVTLDQCVPLPEAQQIPLPEYRGVLDQALSNLIHGVGAYEVDFTIRRRDGELRVVHSRAKLAHDASGRAIAVIGTIQDITSRKRLEEQLLQAQKMESVGHLTGGIAHDFNNLLTVIQGYGVILANGVEPGSPLRTAVEEIRVAAQRAADLTQQLLAFSRKQILRPHVVNLNQVVADAGRMLRRIIGEDIDLVEVPAMGLAGVLVDRGQIEQVIVNLVVNARDAMPHGGKLTIETLNVELTAEYAAGHAEVTPGSYVMLAVTDTGQGMTEATRRHLFEPFFTTKKNGTGLGLSTTYGIVRQSGGHIWVYSEEGRGTTFKIYLPRAAHPATQAETRTTTPSSGPVGGTETILLVEDSDQVRTLIRSVLDQAGYHVLDASSHDDALQLAEQHRGHIDLLLTDVVLPHHNGAELARRLTVSQPTVKVLYMSGYTDNAIVHQGVLDPGVAFLPKPLTPATLMRKVREVLDEK